MTNLELAAAAWAAVRNSDDAPWEVLPLSIKAKLADLAGKYRGGAKVAEGDYPPEGFAEKVAELAGSDVSVGDPIAFIDSRSEVAPRGVVHEIESTHPLPLGLQTDKFSMIAEHEDTHIPSPIPEDVDPLKSDLAEDVETETPVERRISNRRGLLGKQGNIENDRRIALADRRVVPFTETSAK